jgi:hypothetical protein
MKPSALATVFRFGGVELHVEPQPDPPAVNSPSWPGPVVRVVKLPTKSCRLPQSSKAAVNLTESWSTVLCQRYALTSMGQRSVRPITQRAAIIFRKTSIA